MGVHVLLAGLLGSGCFLLLADILDFEYYRQAFWVSGVCYWQVTSLWGCLVF